MNGNSYVWVGNPDAAYSSPAQANVGQNNNNPPGVFDNHAVVKINNQYFDPSYGKTYANLGEIQTQLLSGLGIKFMSGNQGNFHIREYVANDRAMYERYSPYGPKN